MRQDTLSLSLSLSIDIDLDLDLDLDLSRSLSISISLDLSRSRSLSISISSLWEFRLRGFIVSWSILYLDRPCALKSLHAWTISLCLNQVVYLW